MSKARGLADLGNVYDDGALSNRNLIINGAMQVAQRGTSITGITSSQYTLDRWQLIPSGAGTFTVSQEQDGPSAFTNSLKVDCTTADASNTAGELLYLRQMLEGLDCQRLGYGTSGASEVTLSFWVKSNQTETFVLTLQQGASGSLSGKTFSVSTADTWEYKTLTFSGDTANAITNGSGIGLQVHWWLQAGSSYTTGALNSGWDTAALGDYAAGLTATIGDSTSDYFQITGVQLEVGDTATPFEHRSYGDELARCQRYYYSSDEADSYMVAFDVTNGQGYYGTIMLQPTMRTGPTITLSNESLSNFDGLNIFRNYPTRFGWYDTATGSGRGLWQFEWVADAEL